MSNRLLLATTLLVPLTLGCGGSGEQEYSEPETVTETATQNVRVWLEGVAASGELDSGAEIMREELEAMREEGVTNVDELNAQLEELMGAAGSPAAVKREANEMLEMLPAQ